MPYLISAEKKKILVEAMMQLYTWQKKSGLESFVVAVPHLSRRQTLLFFKYRTLRLKEEESEATLDMLHYSVTL